MQWLHICYYSFQGYCLERLVVGLLVVVLIDLDHKNQQFDKMGLTQQELLRRPNLEPNNNRCQGLHHMVGSHRQRSNHHQHHSSRVRRGVFHRDVGMAQLNVQRVGEDLGEDETDEPDVVSVARVLAQVRALANDLVQLDYELVHVLVRVGKAPVYVVMVRGVASAYVNHREIRRVVQNVVPNETVLAHYETADAVPNETVV